MNRDALVERVSVNCGVACPGPNENRKVVLRNVRGLNGSEALDVKDDLSICTRTLDRTLNEGKQNAERTNHD